METKYCVAARIDGDHAWLTRTDAEEDRRFEESFRRLIESRLESGA